MLHFQRSCMTPEIYKTIQMHRTNSKLILKDIQIWELSLQFILNVRHTKLLILVVIWKVRHGTRPCNTWDSTATLGSKLRHSNEQCGRAAIPTIPRYHVK